MNSFLNSSYPYFGSPDKKCAKNLKCHELSKIKASPPSYLKEILKDNGFLDDSEQTKPMTKEHLTLYLIDFLENYSKLKETSEVAAIYFTKYLTQRQITKTSIKKTANSVIYSLGCYASSNYEMKFFCDIFDKKSSSIKEAANYLYCRKVLKSFFYMKNALEDLRIPLGYFLISLEFNFEGSWITLVKKIFGDRVTTDIIDRIKEKIVNNNLQRALGASHDIKKYTNDYQEPNLALCVQTQIMDVDALYFIIICVEELLSEDTQRGSQNNPSRSLSPGNPLYKTPSKRVVYSTKDHQESETPATLLHSASSKDYFSPIPNKDRESLPKPKKFESFPNRNYNSYSPQKMPYLTDSHERVKKGNEKIGDKKSKLNEDNELNNSNNLGNDNMSELKTWVNKDNINNLKDSQEHDFEHESLIKERSELKKQLALETTQKRTSLGILFGTIKLYEKLANNTQTVRSFLKETQTDFKKLLGKLEKSEPNIYRHLNQDFLKQADSNTLNEYDTKKIQEVFRIQDKFEINTADSTQIRQINEAFNQDVKKTISISANFEPKILLSLSDFHQTEEEKINSQNEQAKASSNENENEILPSSSDLSKEKENTNTIAKANLAKEAEESQSKNINANQKNKETEQSKIEALEKQETKKDKVLETKISHIRSQTSPKTIMSNQNIEGSSSEAMEKIQVNEQGQNPELTQSILNQNETLPLQEQEQLGKKIGSMLLGTDKSFENPSQIVNAQNLENDEMNKKDSLISQEIRNEEINRIYDDQPKSSDELKDPFKPKSKFEDLGKDNVLSKKSIEVEQIPFTEKGKLFSSQCSAEKNLTFDNKIENELINSDIVTNNENDHSQSKVQHDKEIISDCSPGIEGRTMMTSIEENINSTPLSHNSQTNETITMVKNFEQQKTQPVEISEIKQLDLNIGERNLQKTGYSENSPGKDTFIGIESQSLNSQIKNASPVSFDYNKTEQGNKLIQQITHLESNNQKDTKKGPSTQICSSTLPLFGTLLPPPKISIPPAIQVLVGSKDSKTLHNNKNSQSVLDQTIQKESEKIVISQETQSQVQVQGQEDQQLDSSQTEKALKVPDQLMQIVDDLPLPPKINILPAIEVLMSTQNNQTIKKHTSVICEPNKVVEKEEKETGKIDSKSEVNQEPVKMQTIQDKNSNQIKGDLPKPPKINIKAGISVIGGDRTSQSSGENEKQQPKPFNNILSEIKARGKSTEEQKKKESLLINEEKSNNNEERVLADTQPNHSIDALKEEKIKNKDLGSLNNKEQEKKVEISVDPKIEQKEEKVNNCTLELAIDKKQEEKIESFVNPEIKKEDTVGESTEIIQVSKVDTIPNESAEKSAIQKIDSQIIQDSSKAVQKIQENTKPKFTIPKFLKKSTEKLSTIPSTEKLNKLQELSVQSEQTLKKVNQTESAQKEIHKTEIKTQNKNVIKEINEEKREPENTKKKNEENSTPQNCVQPETNKSNPDEKSKDNGKQIPLNDTKLDINESKIQKESIKPNNDQINDPKVDPQSNTKSPIEQPKPQEPTKPKFTIPKFLKKNITRDSSDPQNSTLVQENTVKKLEEAKQVENQEIKVSENSQANAVLQDKKEKTSELKQEIKPEIPVITNTKMQEEEKMIVRNHSEEKRDDNLEKLPIEQTQEKAEIIIETNKEKPDVIEKLDTHASAVIDHNLDQKELDIKPVLEEKSIALPALNENNIDKNNGTSVKQEPPTKPAEKKFVPPKFTAPKFGKKA